MNTITITFEDGNQLTVTIDGISPIACITDARIKTYANDYTVIYYNTERMHKAYRNNPKLLNKLQK